MAGRTIEIDVILNDKTNGGVKGIQKELLAMDKAAARLANRFKSFSTQKYMATMRLIDRVTEPASRIQRLLQKIAGGAWQVSFKVADGALAGIRKIESALLRITGRAWSVAVNVGGTAMNKLNGMMSGALMGAGVFAPMAGMMGVGYGVGNAISSAASFEQEMSRVQAIRQLSKDSQDMKDMYALAKKLGMETAWTRQQVAEGMRYQALAGWETPQILKATPHMLNLASAGGMDLGAASDMLTDAMTALGIKATDRFQNAQGKWIDEPEYFADMFAKVQASSNTDLYQLKEATKYSASTIGTMFANIGGQEGVQARTEAARQMLVMAGLMANAGIKGSMAGTGINTIFNRLAGENRNTHFAEKLLGLEHAAENGNMLMPLDFIKAFRNKIQGGMSVDDFLQVAEELSGEKIHADTRRKINSTIENALKNGGKLGSSDMLKIGSMMAGLENAPKLMAMVFQDIEALEAKMNNVEGTAGQMAETMLDNLAGSFTKLGSAWDAFQQDLFTGTAGDGLRNFVDALTEILTRANNLFKDGIDIADFGKIIGDVVSRLKNKFLELDGIGSLLAGGALVMGLKKIISLGQSALNVFKGVGAAGATALGGTAAKGAAGAAAGMSVSTMNVKAGVVNLAGAVKGGGVGGVAGTAGKGAAALTPLALAQKQYDKANAQMLAAQNKRIESWNRVGQLRAMGMGGAQLLTAARASQLSLESYSAARAQFVQSEKALITARATAYKEEIARQKQMTALAREQQSTAKFTTRMSAAGGAAAFAGLFSLLDVMSLKSANAERLAAAPEEQRAQIARENRQAEWEASVGGLGSVVGAGLGAALGSLAGPMGTMIGGIVGSAIGEKLGQYFGDKGAEREVVRDGVNKTVLGKEIDSFLKPDFSFGAKQTSEKTFESFAKFDEQALAWNGSAGKAAQTATQEVRSLEQQLEKDFQTWKTDFKFQNARAKDFSKQWQFNSSGHDYYQQEAKAKWNRIYRGGNEHSGGGGGGSFDEHWGTAGVKPISALSAMLENIFFSRTAAAALPSEYASPQMATTAPTQITAPEIIPPETSPIDEWFNFDGVGERLSDLGAQITDGLSSIMNGAYETVSALGATISEGFSEMVTGTSEIFAGFGEMVTSGLSAAQSAAEGALSSIQSVFTSAKDSVQAAWGELPGFFSGVFSGLGGAAAAAGAAIYSGLTSVIGAVIGAWESAAATVSSIIATISAAASSVAGMIPSIGGGSISAHAEGGFITSPELALIGERGAELILPLTDKERSRELLRQASGVLGLNSEEDGYSISGGSSGGGSMSVSVGGITVNFEINGSDSTDIMEAIKGNIQEIGDKVAAQISKEVRNVFQNQAVVA